MFEKKDTHIKVNMSGTEYMKYKNKPKTSLTKRQLQAIPYFLISAIFLVFLAYIMTNVYAPEPIEHEDTSKILKENMGTILFLSWSDYAKVLIIVYADAIKWLLIAMSIGWILHGVGFHIIKG